MTRCSRRRDHRQDCVQLEGKPGQEAEEEQEAVRDRNLGTRKGGHGGKCSLWQAVSDKMLGNFNRTV